MASREYNCLWSCWRKGRETSLCDFLCLAGSAWVCSWLGWGVRAITGCHSNSSRGIPPWTWIFWFPVNPWRFYWIFWIILWTFLGMWRCDSSFSTFITSWKAVSFLWFLSLAVNWETSGNVTLGEIHILQTKATLTIFSFPGSFGKHKEQQVFHHLWDRFLRGLTNFQVSVALLWPALCSAEGIPAQHLVPGCATGTVWLFFKHS